MIAASTTSPTNSTTSTISPAQKVMVAPISGSVTTGTKMVLTTKVGSPATVTFQQNKNFHQTFATWVKQGQSNSGTHLWLNKRLLSFKKKKFQSFTYWNETFLKKILFLLQPVEQTNCNSRFVTDNVPNITLAKLLSYIISLSTFTWFTYFEWSGMFFLKIQKWATFHALVPS